MDRTDLIFLEESPYMDRQMSRVGGPGGDSPPVKKKVKKYARTMLSKVYVHQILSICIDI